MPIVISHLFILLKGDLLLNEFSHYNKTVKSFSVIQELTTFKSIFH